MELWQTAALELDRLQEFYQKNLTDRQSADAKEQQLKVLLIDFNSKFVFMLDYD